MIIWILGWTPFATIALLQNLGLGSYVNKYASLMAMMLCKSSSVINVYVYGMRCDFKYFFYCNSYNLCIFRLPKFRKRIKPLFQCGSAGQNDMTETQILHNFGFNTSTNKSRSRLFRFKYDAAGSNSDEDKVRMTASDPGGAATGTGSPNDKVTTCTQTATTCFITTTTTAHKNAAGNESADTDETGSDVILESVNKQLTYKVVRGPPLNGCVVRGGIVEKQTKVALRKNNSETLFRHISL